MRIGRISRGTYVITFIIIIGLNLFISKNLDFLISQYLDFESGENLKNLIIYATAMLLIIFLLNAGRLNDINLSGWYALLFFVPLINLGFIALCFIDGTKGNNKYGKDPKERINEKDYSTFIQSIDNNLRLLKESYDEGILGKKEFSNKGAVLLNDRQKLMDKVEKEKKLKKDIEKLKKLLESKIITQIEYDIKLKDLNLKHKLENTHNQSR